MGWWHQTAEMAMHEGYVLALAATCLIQYIAYLHLRQSSRKANNDLNIELDELKGELSQVQRDRAFVRLENQLVREFVTQPDIDRSLSRLLKEFVPDPRYGFAAYLELQDEDFVVRQSRGDVLTKDAIVALPAELITRLAKDKLVSWNAFGVAESPFSFIFPKEEFNTVDRLHLVPILENDLVFGVIVTTQLYPVGMPADWQKELVCRFAACISPALRNAMKHQIQKSKLQLTTEMLSLRALSDMDHGAPLVMFERFLQRLMTMLNAETSSLFLSTTDDTMDKRALVRCGHHMVVGVNRKWEEHEHRLAIMGFSRKAAKHLGENDLKAAGIDSLLGRALVVPMVQNDRIVGVMCFCRKQRTSFSAAQIRLASWAAEYLADRILRALDHAAIAREAKQDGLTQLANRRSFDQLITTEIESAEATGRECSLCLFDIDHFKQINDTYGHQAGDEVLRVVSNILMEQVNQVRATDRPITARYGGEELVVLLPGVGMQGASRIAESIRRSIGRATVPYEEHLINVTVSAGIGCFPHHAVSEHELIRAADSALYHAKRNGRNRVCSASVDAEPEVAAIEI